MPSFRDPPVSFRPSDGVIERVEAWAAKSGLKRNGAINALLERALDQVEQGHRVTSAAVTAVPREVLRQAEAGAAHLGLKNAPARTSPGASDAAVREKLRIPGSVQTGPTVPAMGSRLKKPKAPKGKR